MATILDENDMVISDALNHASIIDGVRICKAKRSVYAHSDMSELEKRLKEAASARNRFVITDGVFSMEGDIAKLPDILELTEKYDAILCVDDSHATGVLGKTGRGSAEHFGLLGKIDVITSTLGKALGGAAGGFTASTSELVDYLIQRSRPQLFSNALPPTVTVSSLEALRVLKETPSLIDSLRDNTAYFRKGLEEIGYRPLPGETPIVPVIVGETSLAIRMSQLLLEEGVFVTGFGYPVVPKGEARLRCQISAAHQRDDLDEVLKAFRKVGEISGYLKTSQQKN
jgi:glycine C-acetyltransferase